MTALTRAEVRANREASIALLKDPATKKGQGRLDTGSGHRCCLGHMCYAMKIDRTEVEDAHLGFVISYDGEKSFAPKFLIEKVGLYDRRGSAYGSEVLEGTAYGTLASWNDHSTVTPQEIGAYLEKHIEGGPNTPWYPLSDYPETIDAN